MQQIGFIGLGLMGRPMAENLLRAGYAVAVWNRSPDKAAPILHAGARWAASPKALAARCDVVITMTTDAAASQAVICAPGGVLDGAHAGLVVIDMSSIDPETSRALAASAGGRGVELLDAPVTGNPDAARAAKLGIMVGGSAEAFDACRPILASLGTVILHVGPSGQGSTLKLINNLILAVAIEAVSEALTLARKAGIEPRRVIEITSVGGARTGAMETRGPKMIGRDFSPGFTVDNMYKDLSNVLRLAGALGVSVPSASASLEMLRAARARGKGPLDSCAVVTELEALANV